MIGRVIKIFSDFYFVETSLGIVEAKLRSVIKKRKDEVYAGDFVSLEQFDKTSMQAFITSVVDRTNLIQRPKAANISSIIIVSALKEPDLDFEQLDRYISLSEFYNINPILCFNKEDINESDCLKNIIDKIYSKLNYKIIYTSAITKTGINELKPFLKNNITLLCGASGVGKSSLINALLDSARQRTLPVSNKTGKGIHTTRHCELIPIDKNSYIVDTPGFSHLKFNFLLPVEVQKLFKEFSEIQINCKYKDCLHINESGCRASDIIKDMPETRLLSYRKFINEAKEYQQKISAESLKKEAKIKYNKNKILTKISEKKRKSARNTQKVNIQKEEMQWKDE